MALTACKPCCNIPGNISNDKFKQDVEVILCGILDAVSGNTLVEASTVDAHISGASGGVQMDPTLVYNNAAAHKFRIINLESTLDVDVEISIDGGATYPYYLFAGNGSLYLDLASDGMYKSQSIYAKAVGNNSVTGVLNFGGTYV